MPPYLRRVRLLDGLCEVRSLGHEALERDEVDELPLLLAAGRAGLERGGYFGHATRVEPVLVAKNQAGAKRLPPSRPSSASSRL
jgi:hypothetical protein